MVGHAIRVIHGWIFFRNKIVKRNCTFFYKCAYFMYFYSDVMTLYSYCIFGKKKVNNIVVDEFYECKTRILKIVRKKRVLGR